MADKDVLEEIINEWEKDSIIDVNRIQDETVATPFLHSKYLRMLSMWKKRRHIYEKKLTELQAVKRRYYRGEMGREELESYGWNQYQGNRMIKTELEETLRGDSDILSIQSKIDLIDTVLYVLESIVKMITSRDFEISNFIKYKMFMKGEE